MVGCGREGCIGNVENESNVLVHTEVEWYGRSSKTRNGLVAVQLYGSRVALDVQRDSGLGEHCMAVTRT
jgi:hypothetical protein